MLVDVQDAPRASGDSAPAPPRASSGVAARWTTRQKSGRRCTNAPVGGDKRRPSLRRSAPTAGWPIGRTAWRRRGLDCARVGPQRDARADLGQRGRRSETWTPQARCRKAMPALGPPMPTPTITPFGRTGCLRGREPIFLCDQSAVPVSGMLADPTRQATCC
jgi:hypothetical protein